MQNFNILAYKYKLHEEPVAMYPVARTIFHDCAV